MGSFAPVPPAAISQILSRFNRPALENFIAVAIDLLDVADGDPEGDEGDAEDAFAFSGLASGIIRQHGEDRLIGCPINDEDGSAWIERTDQTKPALTGPSVALASHEDAEEDDPQGDVTEDDPAFDKRSRRIANGRYHSGPGCTLSDSDHQPGIDFGEMDEAELHDPPAAYGADQTRPVSTDNPALVH